MFILANKKLLKVKRTLVYSRGISKVGLKKIFEL